MYVFLVEAIDNPAKPDVNWRQRPDKIQGENEKETAIMKKILASVLAILMIISMAACGGNSAPAATEAPAAEAPATESAE